MNFRLARMRTLVAAMLALVGAVPTLADDEEDQIIPFQVVVRLAPSVNASAINASYQSTTLEAMPARRWYLLGAPAGLSESDFADLLAADPRVERVELHYTGRDTNPDPGTQSIFFGSNRSRYLANEAWTGIGLPTANTSLGGSGMRVAIIDSGMDTTHPEFIGRVVEPGFNFMDGNTDVRDVGDGIDSDGDGMVDESVGHGTAVAGVIFRVAPSVRVIPLKVLDSDGLTTVFRVSSAIVMAADRGARIINVSLGTTADQSVLREAIQYATQMGSVVVASVGNEGQQSPVRFPSGYSTLPGVIAVGGTSPDGRIASFSNYGPHVSMVAPSVMIVSTIPGGRYGAAAGTSFGAPMVSAAVALMNAQRPTLTAIQSGQLIVSTAAPIAHLNPSYAGQMGSGQLNLHSSLGRRLPTMILRHRVVDR